MELNGSLERGGIVASGGTYEPTKVGQPINCCFEWAINWTIEIPRRDDAAIHGYSDRDFEADGSWLAGAPPSLPSWKRVNGIPSSWKLSVTPCVSPSMANPPASSRSPASPMPPNHSLTNQSFNRNQHGGNSAFHTQFFENVDGVLFHRGRA